MTRNSGRERPGTSDRLASDRMLVGAALPCETSAAANGANDVSKGVATLAGSGITRYRTAVVWGAVTTLVGALASVWLASEMLAGVGVWVIAATVLRLPVSTTHAVVGALIGAGLLLDPRSIHWSALTVSCHPDS